MPGENLPRRVWNRQTKFTYNHWLAALVKARGPLVSEVGYHPRPRKKIYVIRVVFQDQAMYAHTSLKGCKNVQNWEKKGMFLVILTNFGMDMTLKLRKTHAKTRI